MRDFLKQTLLLLPRPMRTVVVYAREAWWRIIMRRWERHSYPHLPTLLPRTRSIKYVLIYAIHGLGHAGTEKSLQLIANTLAESYSVFYMYGDRDAEEERAILLDPRITLIPFSYETDDIAVPHKISRMQPHLKEILAKYSIDLLITASPGYAHYPWNIVTEVPIILSNVFGAPSLQKNIYATIFMSNEVRQHAEEWTGARTTHHTMLLPINKMPPPDVRELGRALRIKRNIPVGDFVFGRIGRDSDAIFDPIGIRAWQKIAPLYPYAHFLIMSPSPLLVKIVKEENIPRVHFLPPSGKEEDVWAFHGALDCFAHFRRDGETSGVAIAESLTIGNPIITHRSHIWNAHLEYLTDDCARVADLDDVAGYAGSSTKFGDGGLGRDQSPYAWTKASNTELVQNYANWYTIPFAITYFYNVYGPGERAGSYGTVIEIFRQKKLNNEPLEVVAPGTQKRNFTHIDDIIDGLILIGENGEGDDFGIGASEAYSILEVATLFCGNITMLPERAGNRMDARLDTSKTRALGWRQQRTLKTYIQGLSL